MWQVWWRGQGLWTCAPAARESCWPAVMRKPCSSVAVPFFFCLFVSRMIEIKYLRRSTKLNGMFGWSQGADRRESSLVMVVSQRNLLLWCHGLQETTPTFASGDSQKWISLRGTSVAPRCESDGFPSVLPRHIYKLWFDYMKMCWYHQTFK